VANGKGNGRSGRNGHGNGDQSGNWTSTAIDVVLTGAKFIGIGAAM